MAVMGKYCKAYLARQFREYPDWTEDCRSLRPPPPDASGPAASEPRVELQDDDILYLQEDYVVTDGIFKDEHIVFAEVCPEWRTFCQNVLKFDLPAPSGSSVVK